ncbi:MAG TPA: hypothetical protein VI455_11810, partial [Terriglobia bacterium]
EYACRVGFFHGMLIKRLCTVGWAMVGLMAAVMVKRAIFGVHSLPDPEDAFGFACRQLLSPGFRGLLIASVMGASLASCSALMIDSGALFTQGFYRSRLGRGRSERHYLWVGRVSGLLAVLIAILYALFLIEKVLYSFLLTETLATYMGISIVTGLVWRRANRWGAAASVVVALLTNFLLYHAKSERLDYWDPDIFLVALAAGITSLVVVSLLTAPEPEDRISSFFDQLEIPSDLPPEAASGARQRPAEGRRQLLMVNLLHLRRGACGASLLKAYRDDLRGLAMGAAVSVGLVAGLWILLKL